MHVVMCLCVCTLARHILNCTPFVHTKILLYGIVCTCCSRGRCLAAVLLTERLLLYCVWMPARIVRPPRAVKHCERGEAELLMSEAIHLAAWLSAQAPCPQHTAAKQVSGQQACGPSWAMLLRYCSHKQHKTSTCYIALAAADGL